MGKGVEKKEPTGTDAAMLTGQVYSNLASGG
jgi:hypothetical protein